MVRRESEEEKGERGHHVTCTISLRKSDNCPRLRLVNLPTFRLGVIFPRPGNIISGCISCSSTHERISIMEKTLQNTLLMSSLRDGNAIETLLTTEQINKDFVNHPVQSTTKPSTSLVRVGTDACKSIINFILRYKDYDFHKNAWTR
ncbi:uncharacterized protein TNCV_2091351 [Trichonephila clavipes]|nr:uncharacterized protein TNCV_2091351 [Trichonephila clavipes]